MTDWIAQKPGDPMPVDGDTVVEVIYSNGFPSCCNPDAAKGWSWGLNTGGVCDIVAYRIHKPEPSTWEQRNQEDDAMPTFHAESGVNKEIDRQYLKGRTGSGSLFCEPNDGAWARYHRQVARHEELNAQKEKEVKYKAGDKVTIELNERGAKSMTETELLGGYVVNHEPAPEPVVGYVYMDINKDYYYGCNEKTVMKNGEQKFRITYNPATKEVKAEVV